MATRIDARMALVVGVKQDEGGYSVAVRGNFGGMVVNMLPNSAVPLVGDSVFVVITDEGNYGVALTPAPPSANLSINLPIATGDVPTAGLYVPVLSDFSATIIGVRVMLLDATGATVSDTCTMNIKRTDFGTGSTSNLNTSAFGPSAAYFYEDTVLTGWTLDIAAHDTLQVELVSAPSTAVYIGLSLDVLRA